MPAWTVLGAGLALLAALTPAAADDGSDSAAAGPPGLAAADALWAQRAEGHQAGRAAAEPIGRAVEAYEQLLAADPGSLEIRWKLMRALHFQGEYVASDPAAKLVIFERGRTVADEARDALQQRVGLAPKERDPEVVAGAVRAQPQAIEIYFYSAAHWGLWGKYTGKMKAARQGVAAQVRDYARTVVLLDERFDGAGGLRVLGRLHTEAPKIPFATGWIDRDEAVNDLDRACLLAPDRPQNQLFLAEALLRFARQRRDEAVARLEGIIARGPRPTNLVEDLATLADAETLLAEQR